MNDILDKKYEGSLIWHDIAELVQRSWSEHYPQGRLGRWSLHINAEEAQRWVLSTYSPPNDIRFTLEDGHYVFHSVYGEIIFCPEQSLIGKLILERKATSLED